MRGNHAAQGSNTEGGGAQGAHPNNNVPVCKQVFQDCIQFKNHQRQMQGSNQKCNCRCLAKNCSKDHFSNAATGMH